jgi:hypothetical protein
MLFAVLLPVLWIPAAPFLRAVLAHLAVFCVCFQLLLPVFAPSPLLTTHFTANRLERLILRWLKSPLTIAAAPFSHTGRYRIQEKAKNLEADLECLPRPAHGLGKPSQTYLKFFESASLGDLLGRIAEDGCNPVAVVVGVDEGGPLDAVATLPSDGECSIGFLQVNRFGLSASG